MALNHGYNAIFVWDTDHVVQTSADLTMDVSRGVIDITTHGSASLPFRSFKLGLVDPQDIVLPIQWDYSRAEIGEMISALWCETETECRFEGSASSTEPWFLGNCLVTKISPSGRMENEIQIVNVTFRVTGKPTTVLGYAV